MALLTERLKSGWNLWCGGVLRRFRTGQRCGWVGERLRRCWLEPKRGGKQQKKCDAVNDADEVVGRPVLYGVRPELPTAVEAKRRMCETFHCGERSTNRTR